MKILTSTFRDGDDEKILLAMRSLPYDRLVLFGHDDAEGPSLEKFRRLERLSGHEAGFREIGTASFMEMVDSISEELADLGSDKETGSRNEVTLNISGGSKIMGDAALLAAFRLGVEAYHCDRVVIKLPVLRGATAKDRFTGLQVRLLDIMADREKPLAEVIRAMQPNSKASSERTIRELRRLRLIKVRSEGGQVHLGLSSEGLEVARAVRFARAR